MAFVGNAVQKDFKDSQTQNRKRKRYEQDNKGNDQ